MNRNPKYRIEQCNKYNQTVWVIKSSSLAILSWHETKEDAQKTVQRYVEDDNWHAMNR